MNGFVFVRIEVIDSDIDDNDHGPWRLYMTWVGVGDTCVSKN